MFAFKSWVKNSNISKITATNMKTSPIWQILANQDCQIEIQFFINDSFINKLNLRHWQTQKNPAISARFFIYILTQNRSRINIFDNPVTRFIHKPVRKINSPRLGPLCKMRVCADNRSFFDRILKRFADMNGPRKSGGGLIII